MMFNKEKVSERLKALRGTRTQSEMAEILGIAQQGWARYETGKVVPGAEVIHQICVKLHVSADYLLGLSDSQDGLGLAPPTASRDIERLRADAAQVCIRADSFIAAVDNLKETLQRFSSTKA